MKNLREPSISKDSVKLIQ